MDKTEWDTIISAVNILPVIMRGVTLATKSYKLTIANLSVFAWDYNMATGSKRLTILMC